MLSSGQRVALVEDVKDPKDAQVELYYIGWSTSSDTDWAIRPIFESKNAPPVLANEGYYSNKSVDALLDKALGVTDPTDNDMEAVVRKQTSFRLREDLLQILQEHAKKANRSLNNFVESTLMNAMYSEPNEETTAAINEARSGKYAGTIDTTDFDSFMKSVNEIE